MTPYTALRSLTSAAAIFHVFFTVGMGMPASEHVQSLARSSATCDGDFVPIKLQNHYTSCKCKGRGQGNRQNGSLCIKTALGHDKELTGKTGKCEGGECVLTKFDNNCTESQAPPVDEKNPPVGCVFYCDTTKPIFGYFPVGTRCKHIIKGSKYVNATCVKSGTETLCREMSAYPAC
uniref:Putative secreted protein n=1 Tax=Amblyomma americanum TaxID=6943 RepID=A0A0C9RXK2_AMBAM